MATPSVILDPIRGDDGAEQLLINVKSFCTGAAPGGLDLFGGVFILYRGLGFLSCHLLLYIQFCGGGQSYLLCLSVKCCTMADRGCISLFCLTEF